jgi:general secretion pathway protein C
MVFPTNKSKSFSTIASKKGEDTENYYNGDKILGEAKIYEIERNRVYFIRAGRREYIEVANLPKWSTPPSNNAASEDSTLGIEVQGDKVVISRAKVDASLSDLNKVIQQARMVPNFKDGKVNGFKIFAIRNGSIFQELTIKNGDIIHQINGNEVNSVEKALPLLSLLRDEQEISIDITRRGRSQTLKYEIR